MKSSFRPFEFLLAVAILLGVTHDAAATHFRFANLSWKRAPGTNALAVEITVTEAWQKFSKGTVPYDFGDGTGSMAANPSHLYTAAGNYTATLVVTDVAGLTASASKVITVQPALPATAIYVSDIVMSKATGTRGTQAKAIVTIKDGTGKLKANATVSGAWTGLTASSASVKTGSAGTAPFLSAWTNLNGTFTFKVTKVVLSGFTYTPAANVETTDFIAK